MEPPLQRGTAGGRGPQKLVTTTEGAIHLLQGGEWETAMTRFKSGRPAYSHRLGEAPSHLPPGKKVLVAQYGREDSGVLEFNEVNITVPMFVYHSYTQVGHVKVHTKLHHCWKHSYYSV
jgi:hypothetical protein